MTAAILLLVAISAGALACWAATGARALRDFSSHELQETCQKHNTPKRFGEILEHRDGVALAVENLRLLATAVASASGSLWMWLRWAGEGNWAVGLTAAAAGILLLLAGAIWVPHAVVMGWSEIFLYRTWRQWYVISQLMSPLVVVGRLIMSVVHKLAGHKPEEATNGSVEDEIRSIVTEGHHEGLIEEEAYEMIEGIIELGDAEVAEIMTPRTDMVSLHVEMPWEEMVSFVVEAGHTRIPVYGKNRDEIVGVLHAKDLLSELAKSDVSQRNTLVDFLRKPYFVPGGKPVIELLQEFQRSRTHIAIVLDEFGGVSGVVTIEDVLEEIVGEIADEYDEDLVDGLKQIDPNTTEALARMRIEEVNERLNLNLPEDQDYETLGGFVFHEMGRIPAVGEELVWQNLRIEVIDATRRRIDRVIIEVLHDAQKTA